MARKLKASEVAAILIVSGIGIWWYAGGGAVDAANDNMQTITNQVAQDAVTKYGIAKRNGSKIDICVAAMGVTASYLQAKDESNYATWKKTESADCSEAGMPQPQ